jgi:hypothetical protein
VVILGCIYFYLILVNIMTEMVILEYGPPSDELLARSLELKKLPVPLHAIGDIVIIPGKNSKPIYTVVSLICSMGDTFDGEWVYGSIGNFDNPLGVTYTPESLVVKRRSNK